MNFSWVAGPGEYDVDHILDPNPISLGACYCCRYWSSVVVRLLTHEIWPHQTAQRSTMTGGAFSMSQEAPMGLRKRPDLSVSIPPIYYM
jgi:hypothetical protein